jgi:dienelactone hydrolase
MEEVLLAAALATQGYPTLDIAYFKEPGLPQALEDIPLEYFAKALRWLASRPGVDSRRIWVDGSSRGSEAALLLGVHYPGLVHGVVALVPSDAAICSYPGCAGPAWTFQGKAVPYTKQFDDPHPTDDPAAVIPVTKIQGPVFLDCGGSDQVWSSCPYAQAVMAQLAAAHDRYPHVLMVSQEGGHGSALVLPPYEPGAAESEWESEVGGSTAIANDLAWAAQWPRFVDFLQN